MRECHSVRINLAPERLAEWFSHGLGQSRLFIGAAAESAFHLEPEVAGQGRRTSASPPAPSPALQGPPAAPYALKPPPASPELPPERAGTLGGFLQQAHTCWAISSNLPSRAPAEHVLDHQCGLGDRRPLADHGWSPVVPGALKRSVAGRWLRKNPSRTKVFTAAMSGAKKRSSP